VLTDGDSVELTGGLQGGDAIVRAARPLLEPIAQYGPFMMNTRDEIEQAIRDHQMGDLRMMRPNRHERLATAAARRCLDTNRHAAGGV
jgi:hypothetical protein